MVKPTLLVLAAGMGSRYGSLKQMEAEIIRSLLAKHPADEVCARLGISRVTLWRKMKNMTIAGPASLR